MSPTKTLDFVLPNKAFLRLVQVQKMKHLTYLSMDKHQCVSEAYEMIVYLISIISCCSQDGPSSSISRTAVADHVS